MKKIGRDKLVEAQIEGLSKAYTWMREYGYEDGLKKIEDEVKFRNITYLPLSYSKEKINDYLYAVKEDLLASTLLLTMVTIRDEFGFGKQRMEKFWKRYTLKTSCLIDKALTDLNWEDLAEQCKQELGFDIQFNWDAWREKNDCACKCK